MRPKNALFVEETGSIVLLVALRRKKDFMSDRRLLPAPSVLRVLCTALDEHFRGYRPIFSVSPGTAENMYMLATIRAVMEAIFKRGKLEICIATAIIPFLKKAMIKQPETGNKCTSEPNPKRKKTDAPCTKFLSQFCSPAVSNIALALGSDQNRVGLQALHRRRVLPHRWSLLYIRRGPNEYDGVLSCDHTGSINPGHFEVRFGILGRRCDSNAFIT